MSGITRTDYRAVVDGFVKAIHRRKNTLCEAIQFIIAQGKLSLCPDIDPFSYAPRLPTPSELTVAFTRLGFTENGEQRVISAAGKHVAKITILLRC